MVEKLFSLRGEEFTPREKVVIEAAGLTTLVFLWWLITVISGVRKELLPSPIGVVTSIPELHFKDALVRNACFSIWLNILGYTEAIAVALPLGFIIGLFPITRVMFERSMTTSRFLPLPAITGLCILWFGMGTNMKVQFLAMGIFVYLLPVVAQRVVEVQKVYVDTVTTLGATQWQTIKSVFIPDVLSRVFTDILILVAISWTYITVAETINQGQGGIGALCQISARESRADKTFALLMTIILIGFVQDKLGRLLDRIFFRHKYAPTKRG